MKRSSINKSSVGAGAVDAPPARGDSANTNPMACPDDSIGEDIFDSLFLEGERREREGNILQSFELYSRLIRQLEKEEKKGKESLTDMAALAQAYFQRARLCYFYQKQDTCLPDSRKAAALFSRLRAFPGYQWEPQRKESLFLQGIELSARKDYSACKQVIGQAVEIACQGTEELCRIEGRALCVCGDIYQLEKQPDRAEEAYRRALQSLPPKPQAREDWARRGRIQQRIAQITQEPAAEKAELWRQAAESFEAGGCQESILCWKMASRLLEESGQSDRAYACYDRAIAYLEGREGLTPEELGLLAELYTFRGLWQYRYGHYEKELSDYDIAVSLRLRAGEIEGNAEDLSIVYCNCADTWARRGDYEKASAVYARAEKSLMSMKVFDQGKRMRSLARLYYEQGEHYKENPDYIEKAAAAYSKAIGGYQTALNETLGEEKEEGVQEELTEFLALSYNGRGVCRYALKEYEKEIDDCTQALGLRKQLEDSAENRLQMAIIYRNRADCFDMLERFDLAGEDYDCALEIYFELEEKEGCRLPLPEMADLLLSDARVHDGLGEFELAISRYSEALRRLEKEDTGMENNLEYLGLSYFRRGMDYYKFREHLYALSMRDYCSAIQVLERMPLNVRTEGFLAMALRTRGELYAAMGEYDLARQDFSRAKEMAGKAEKDRMRESLGE